MIVESECESPSFQKTMMLKQELRKAQVIILQQQKLIQTQKDLREQKMELDALKQSVTQNLNFEMMKLKSQIVTLKETIRELEMENQRLLQSNKVLKAAYEQSMGMLNNENQEISVHDKQRKISQIKRQNYEISIAKIAPLPPPPPPPPVVANNQKMNVSSVSQRRKPKLNTKQVCWEPIHQNKVKGTLWEKLNDSQIQLDWDRLEELFQFVDYSKGHQQDPQKIVQLKSQLLSQERQRSIELVIQKYKLKSRELIGKLTELDLSVLHQEMIEALVKCLPIGENEITQFSKSDQSKDKMSIPEIFLYDIIQTPNIEKRIRILNFYHSFQENKMLLQEKLQQIIECCKQIKKNKELEYLFLYTLAVGNFLNGNSQRGVAVGFRVESFDRTMMVKAKDNETTLLMYIIDKLESNPYRKITIVDNEESMGGSHLFTRHELEKWKEMQKNSLIQLLNNEIYQIKQGQINLNELLKMDESKMLNEFKIEVEQFQKTADELFIQAQTEYEDLCHYFGESFYNYESDKVFTKLYTLFNLVNSTQILWNERKNRVVKAKVEVQTKIQLANVRQSILINQSPEGQKQIAQIGQLKNQSLAQLLKLKKAFHKK